MKGHGKGTKGNNAALFQGLSGCSSCNQNKYQDNE